MLHKSNIGEKIVIQCEQSYSGKDGVDDVDGIYHCDPFSLQYGILVH